VFLLKLSLRPWRLAPLSHGFSSVAVGFLLLVAGFLFWLQDGLKPVVARLQGEQVITAYLAAPELAPDAVQENGAEAAQITDAIRVAVGAQAVLPPDVQYVSSQQFVKNLSATYPELSRELEVLGPEMAAVVPRYVSVTGLLGESALERVRAVPGVESAESSRDRYARVVGAFLALRWVARLLVAGAALALLTGLIHLSRLNAYMHREALTILKLWGAGALEMRAPAMISGALVGALGGCAAGAGWLLAGHGLSQQIRSLSPMLAGLPAASATLALGLAGAGILIGICAGALGGVAPDNSAQQGARG
jgi:cell division protein FtsX